MFFTPMDFLRAAQVMRSGDLDDFAEIVPGRTPAPGASETESSEARADMQQCER